MRDEEIAVMGITKAVHNFGVGSGIRQQTNVGSNKFAAASSTGGRAMPTHGLRLQAYRLLALALKAHDEGRLPMPVT
jgi:hypothetical protein